MKISVCMATYNGSAYLAEQVMSILCQLGEDDELVVSDDNSTDNTLDIIASFHDKRIHVYTNERDRGYTENFENAMQHALGEYIFLSDQDDIWKSEKVAVMTRYLNRYDFVASDCVIVDQDLNVLSESRISQKNIKHGFLRNLWSTRYLGSCMAFRRCVLAKCLPFPKNKRICVHDYWILLVSELYFKTCLINQPLILYRRHSLNASDGGERSTNTLLKKLQIRIYAIYNLIRVVYR
jgi:glycosyltransferase involved in cell wall biosynthesis